MHRRTEILQLDSRLAMRPTDARVLMGNKGTHQEAKWLEHDTEQSVPSSAE